ncbi:NADH-quinone reductase [Alteromonas sediminis]|uniref:NADH-quinone reductase n=1 Tax=Alteromonas sediminis TaxID=2259342 RepID=A0A3N5XZW6_9ALTE|nr:DUF6482 family protein [Alteromonas sediminis]RPJ66732.1 NADH-quinone reductase [Alteromonas sediminis]
MKFVYSELLKNPPCIDLLEVHSFEMNVYLVNIAVGQHAGMVYDDSDKPKRFHSSGHIREAFAAFSVKKAVMVHDTPYDEMIGNPPKASEKMALPFSMDLPY